jgi:hypothetical protein
MSALASTVSLGVQSSVLVIVGLQDPRSSAVGSTLRADGDQVILLYHGRIPLSSFAGAAETL